MCTVMCGEASQWGRGFAFHALCQVQTVPVVRTQMVTQLEEGVCDTKFYSARDNSLNIVSIQIFAECNFHESLCVRIFVILFS